MSTTHLSIAEVEALTRRALIACNTSEANADSVTRSVVASELDGISGLHFHTLCEQDFPPLARTLAAVDSSVMLIVLMSCSALTSRANRE